MKMEAQKLLNKVDEQIKRNTKPIPLKYNIPLIHNVMVVQNKLNHLWYKTGVDKYEKYGDWLDVGVDNNDFNKVIVNIKENAPLWVTDLFKEGVAV